MVVIAVVASVATGIIYSAADAYAGAAEQRRAMERVGLAMDRVVREIREAPSPDGAAGEADIVTAEIDDLEFGNGVRLELIGQTLWLTTPDSDAALLCSEVEAFELSYLGEDGQTDASATPAQIQRIRIRLRAGGTELRATAFLRATLGGVS